MEAVPQKFRGWIAGVWQNGEHGWNDGGLGWHRPIPGIVGDRFLLGIFSLVGDAVAFMQVANMQKMMGGKMKGRR